MSRFTPMQDRVLAALARIEGDFTCRDVVRALDDPTGSPKEAASVSACLRNLWVRRRLDRVQAGTRGRGRMSVYRVAEGGGA